ncbi:sulfotransferase family protein [Oceanobacter mangrovi]|uniref:sulfotransferase family protein n=1 Tax=Oceanobacter mangrovi TaxID=2862510 RepID=UPI001C8E11F3|nr:sulfotransferase family protein [Oceanobacter mangrovi]
MAYWVRFFKDTIPSRVLWFIERSFGKGFYKKKYRESKIIFVHIPKNAGVFVNKSLYGVEHLGHNSIVNIMKYDREYCAGKFFFCLSRNPYERFVSAFSFLYQGGGDVGADPAYVNLVRSYGDINQFIMHWLRGRNVDELDYVFKSQAYFVFDRKLLVDEFYDLGKLDMDCLSKSISDAAGEVVKFEKERRNTSSVAVKEKFKLDDTSKSLLGDIYSIDFEVFGYEK